MKQLHKRIALYVMLMTLIPASVSGAGLGKIKVKSALGEPLDAEIELVESPPEDSKPITAKVGSDEDYASAGLQDSYIPQGVRVQVIRNPDNSRVLHLTSDRPVNEPFLELLIKAESPTTNLLRQYTLLLDPPTSRLGDEAERPVKADTARTSTRQRKVAATTESVDESIAEYIPRKARKSAAHKTKLESSTAVAENAVHNSEPASGDSYMTQSGDVFGKVAQRYQPEGVSLKKVMKAFFVANPEAFVDGDMNQLKAGQTLRIPSQEAMQGGAAKTGTDPAKKPEKPYASAETKDQAVKLEPSPKYVLKISPGDTDSASGEKSGEAELTPAATSDKAAAGDASATASPPAGSAGAAKVEADATQPEQAPPAAPVAVTPVDKPLAVAASPEEKSLLDAFVANVPWIAFGMAIPLLFFLALYFINRRRLAAMSDLHEYELDDEAIQPEAAPIERGLGETPLYEASRSQVAPVVNSVATTYVPSASLPSTPAPTQAPADPEMDIHEVDPLVEAEIYMSYGRDEQAEKILKNALVRTPHKHELSLGLLRIYADRRDSQEFEHVARTIYQAAELGGLNDVVIWGKAAILGGQIDPSNALYRIEGLVQERVAEPVSIPASGQIVEAPASGFASSIAAIDAGIADFPELPPLQAAETQPEQPLSFPDLELPKDLALPENSDADEHTDTPKTNAKSNILEFTLDDFMPASPKDDLEHVDELFPAPKKK